MPSSRIRKILLRSIALDSSYAEARNSEERKDARGQVMKTTELDRFRKNLKTKQAELRHGRRNREAVAIETSADELDRIQHAQERDLAMEALDRETLRSREIAAALERIDNGSFGICVNCEEEIAAKRLAAVPWTALCIGCQEVAERITSDTRNEDDPLLKAA